MTAIRADVGHRVVEPNVAGHHDAKQVPRAPCRDARVKPKNTSYTYVA